MYDVTFPPATSSADWAASVEIIDDSTNAPLDLTGYSASLAVRDHDRNEVLSASTADGTITNPTTGVLSWTFAASQLSGLDVPLTYNVGLTITDANGTTQIFVGKLPFIDGYV